MEQSTRKQLLRDLKVKNLAESMYGNPLSINLVSEIPVTWSFESDHKVRLLPAEITDVERFVWGASLDRHKDLRYDPVGARLGLELGCNGFMRNVIINIIAEELGK